MKFFVAFAALVTVAFAGSVHYDDSQLQAIINAINSPHTDPATAALLQDQLDAILNAIEPTPVVVGPAIVDDYEPISVGPAIIDEYEPISVGPALVDGPIPNPAAAGSPLVQVIINVNAGNPRPIEDIAVGPALIDFDPIPVEAEPVIIEENPQPIQPEPVQIADAVFPTPSVMKH